MNILTVSNTDFNFGSYNRQTEMASLLCEKGHEVFWIAPTTKHKKSTIKYLDFKFFKSNRVTILNIILTYIHIFIYAKKMKKIDKVYVLREYDAFIFQLPFISKLLNNPEVLFFQRANTHRKELFALKYEKRFFKAFKNFIFIYLYPKFQNFIFTRVDKIVVQTPNHMNYINELLGLDYEESVNFFILPNNSNIRWLKDHSNQELSLDKSKFNIGMIANIFFHSKGLGVAIKAIQILKEKHNFKEVSLHIIGGGPNDEVSKTKNYIFNTHTTDEVILHGKIEKAYTLVDNFDLMVVPSKIDDCPNVLLEVLSNKKNLLASNIDAHRFLLDNREDLLFENNNPNDLSIKIYNFINDKNLRVKNSDNVIDLNKNSNFDWSIMLENIFLANK